MYNEGQNTMQTNKNYLTRRTMLRLSTAGAAAAFSPFIRPKTAGSASGSLRMGGPVFEKYQGPDEWVQALLKRGYRAAYCPVDADAADDVVNAYAGAAEKADITIAEVGAWSNPISPDEKERNEALEKCRKNLALAERIGARCCVNITGSRGEKWDGPDKKNLTEETFDLIVETTRSIIDAVKPARTFYTLETMPWAYPDSTDSYAGLVKAIDRKQCAVHFDPVNLVCSPQRYYSNAEMIKEFFRKLGPMIRSCHAKDILLQQTLTTHLDEVRPGLGGLDYAVYLKELSAFPDAPLMIEHLKTPEEFSLAAEHIRSVAKANGIQIS